MVHCSKLTPAQHRIVDHFGVMEKREVAAYEMLMVSHSYRPLDQLTREEFSRIASEVQSIAGRMAEEVGDVWPALAMSMG